MDLDKKKKVLFLDSLEFQDEFKLSFLNRCRLLFGGNLVAIIKLDTQKPVGQHRYDSGYLIEPVFPAKVRYRAREIARRLMFWRLRRKISSKNAETL